MKLSDLMNVVSVLSDCIKSETETTKDMFDYIHFAQPRIQGCIDVLQNLISQPITK